MAKKDNFDDVLGNKFSLMNAKSSKLLSSWMGPETAASQTTTAVSETQGAGADTNADADADLKQPAFGHDRLGVGSPIPSSILDGSFTRRAPTTNDKLLEQLIGKKRAKAHLAAKQDAERVAARQVPSWQGKEEGRGVKVKEEESGDEEEGRAVVLGRGRGGRGEVQAGVKVGDETGEGGAVGGVVEGEEKGQEEDDDDDDIDLKPKKRVKKSKVKQASYLDELLAERSRKKKGKGKGGEEA